MATNWPPVAIKMIVARQVNTPNQEVEHQHSFNGGQTQTGGSLGRTKYCLEKCQRQSHVYQLHILAESVNLSALLASN